MPAALGSDTGGSVRIPSALCGLTGLKTTYGLVSLYGAVPLSTTLDTIGPLAHTAEDVALLTAAIAGPDPHDPATLGAPRVDFADALTLAPDVRGMRIACLAPEQFPAYIDDEVVRARHQAIDVLRVLGATVEEVRAPIDFDDIAVRVGKLLAAEAYAYHRGHIEDAALPFDPWVRKRVLGGKSISAADYIGDLTAMRRAQAAFAAWMHGRDALLTPTSADHRGTRRGRRRSDGATRRVHARGQLSGRLRAVAARRLFGHRPADRRAAGRRAVRGSHARATRSRVPGRDGLAPAAAGAAGRHASARNMIHRSASSMCRVGTGLRPARPSGIFCSPNCSGIRPNRHRSNVAHGCLQAMNSTLRRSLR